MSVGNEQCEDSPYMRKIFDFPNKHCGIEVTMFENRILYEDSHILVCYKPAGIATQTARIGQADMVSEMENYLARNLLQGRAKEKPQGSRQNETGRKPPHACGSGIKPSRIYVVHRLDQPVEGILVFARQQAAAAALSAQAAGDEMEKEYLALVCDLREDAADGRRGDEWQVEPIQGSGQFAESAKAGQREQSGILTDYLLKDGKTNLSRVVSSEVKGAKEARLSYEILRDISEEAVAAVKEECDGFSENVRTEKQLPSAVVKIRLYTGRHHQIRVQMANAGLPLLGDRKYAPKEAIALSERLGIRDVALCAYRLSFLHPQTKERMQFEIEPQGTAFRGIIS